MRHARMLTLSLLFAGPPVLLSQTAAKKPSHTSNVALEAQLTEREKAGQLLSRFTFGPRPGDIDAVMKAGPQNWFEQQLNPESIPDPVIDKRLQDYPALALTSALSVSNFPTNQILKQISEGKQSMPKDPTTLSVYQVLEAKYTRQQQEKKDEQTNKLTPEQVDAQKAEQKKQDQATAFSVAVQMLGIPKAQRMTAILQLPLDQRSALASSTPDPQKKMLLADFTPRERELFLSIGGGPDAAHVVDDELMQAKVLRAILSERQLQEVMTDFWFNHFNVFLYKETDQIYTPSYERDAIRPHALGKFRDLLLATAQHPAMLVYLDNWQSIGPDSEVAEKAKYGEKHVERGLNENYGREVMELHTVGVNGGYTQADVTNLAKILTGWTIDHPEYGGGPQFDPRKHEPGSKIWFGQKIKEDGFNEGHSALIWLAAQPQTAHFISYKLAQRFVADDPPPTLVDHMAQSFLSSDGDIKEVLRTMERSPEFWSRKYYRTKVKTPLEFVASAFRATETNPTKPAAVVNTLKTMGEPLYQMQPPTGYPMTADHWMNSAAIVDRLNFSLALTGGKLGGIPFDAPRLLASSLLDRQAEQPSSTMHRIAVKDTAASGNSESMSGREEALGLMEQMVVGGSVSPKTNAVILKQISDSETGAVEPAMPAVPTDSIQVLNTMAALILGSPEFQLK
jgi:uncharacterized protein (DUF1800 family)